MNTCAAALLPDGTVGAAPELDFICAETELWGAARKMNQYVSKKGSGPGMVGWAYLGRFDLAAVALVRHRCCPGAEPLEVATPKGPCSTLTESTRAAGAAPTQANVDAYAKDVACLISRGIRYPKGWWDRVGPDHARASFEKFLGTLRPPP